MDAPFHSGHLLPHLRKCGGTSPFPRSGTPQQRLRIGYLTPAALAPPRGRPTEKQRLLPSGRRSRKGGVGGPAFHVTPPPPCPWPSSTHTSAVRAPATAHGTAAPCAAPRTTPRTAPGAWGRPRRPRRHRRRPPQVNRRPATAERGRSAADGPNTRLGGSRAIVRHQRPSAMRGCWPYAWDGRVPAFVPQLVARRHVARRHVLRRLSRWREQRVEKHVTYAHRVCRFPLSHSVAHPLSQGGGEGRWGQGASNPVAKNCGE